MNGRFAVCFAEPTAAMEELSIRLKIADREYGIKAEPDNETLVRDAGRLIQEELKKYRDMGVRDTQDALAMLAFDCLVTKLRSDQQIQRLQRMVFDKITQLDQVVTPAITS